MRKHQLGVTLLEVLLALAIGAAVILMGIKQYQQYQTQQYIAQLQFNIDELFQGMGLYYQANCTSLNPSTTNVPIDISTGLQTPGYLRTQWQPFNPLINNTSTANYVVQLNVSGTTPTKRYASACWNFTGQQSGLDCSPTPTVTQSPVYIWRTQVAVEFPSSANMEAYQSIFGADCISDISGSVVTPCESSPPSTTGHYLVWERLPSFATTTSSSGLWPSMQVLHEFNLQYNHDQMYELQNPSYVSSYYTAVNNTPADAPPINASQNYMCGG